MHHADCVVIGAGQAGLAMSRCLTDRGVDHVVLERGRVAERWRSERWTSLRLLTPNWQSRLPGFRYDGADPDGYMTMPEVIAYFERYAASFAAPVRCGVDVTAVARADDHGFRIDTSQGTWRAASVVIATGHADRPSVPPLAGRVPEWVAQVVPTTYRSPDQLRPGGVLVVGASASGIQLADEIHRAGRDVTIAVGHHTRLPRTYRGRDILWWLDRMGVFDESVGQVYDVDISREQPSLQLVGSPEHRTLDLQGLRAAGVRVVGRLLDIGRAVARFDDNLVATTAAADIKLASLLRRIDSFIGSCGITAPAAAPFTPQCLTFVGAETELDLRQAGIGTVLWATGFRRHYPWLRVPILDRHGEICHDGGITPEPGLYAIGLHFLRRRNSSFIDGVGTDALALADHLTQFLRRGTVPVTFVKEDRLRDSFVGGRSPLLDENRCVGARS
jgi:putative flavoprotein involved in K+ transport